MNHLNHSFIAPHIHGGLKCFANDHQDEARFFPEILWGPVISHLVRAQWCVIAGANRMILLSKPTLLSHSGGPFESLLMKYPGLEDRYLPRLWWPSVIKRGVSTLWPELLKVEGRGSDRRTRPSGAIGASAGLRPSRRARDGVTGSHQHGWGPGDRSSGPSVLNELESER